MKSYKGHFARFLAAAPDRIHLAAHSHHYWPDVSFDAHAQAWLDAARLADGKWETVLGDVVPRAQRHVAEVLGLPEARSVAFAPNTHELVVRLLSSLPSRPRILTTDAEFHSFTRQVARLEEEDLVEVERVSVEPFGSFVERFTSRARARPQDLVFLSHVFFSSGWAVPDLAAIADAASPDAIVVVDGYHAFMALPVSLGRLAARVFYLGGGYKYAMSGEGACFLHAPPGYAPRPRNTGWFAAFGALAAKPQGVPYAEDGARFFGATFDPSGLYRFNAVMKWLADVGLDAAAIRDHTRALQRQLVDGLGPEHVVKRDELVVPIDEPSRGQFLTFRTPRAAAVHDALLARNVVTDVRGDRLRFGFAIYHDPEDIDRALARLRA